MGSTVLGFRLSREDGLHVISMRVLHIIDSGGLYGTGKMVLDLITEQAHMGLRPVLASIGAFRDGQKPVEAEARRRGLRVKTFRMRLGPNLFGAYRILEFARKERIEVFHSHGYIR